jgi:hypothetical protein
VPRRDPEARKAADRARNADPLRKASNAHRMRAKRWRDGSSFRCGLCARRFSKLREAWTLRHGRRVKLGLCAFCAGALKGALKAA